MTKNPIFTGAATALVTPLNENGVETTVRRKLGSDIDAACGQLRRSHMKEQTKEN